MIKSVPGVTVSLQELVRLQARARNIEIRGKTKPMASRTGPHLSKHHGRGLEFDEVRAYQAGDDIRSIDWRVTARRGKPHTKLYREERERPVFILVDMHPGMYFGTRLQFKSVLASRLAALLAWTASLKGDRVGGVVVNGKSCAIIPPRLRKEGVLRLLHTLVEAQPDKPQDIGQYLLQDGLARLRHISHPGSTCIVLSDFAGIDDACKKSLVTLAGHSDLYAGYIFDPFETQAPGKGRFRFGSPSQLLDIESGSPEVKDVWRASFTGRLESLQDLSHRSQMTLIELTTALPAHEQLHQAFRSLVTRSAQ